MSDANVRRTRVRWCILATILFAVVAALVSVEWGPLMDLDEAVGEWPEQFTRAHEPVRDFWYAIAVGTGAAYPGRAAHTRPCFDVTRAWPGCTSTSTRGRS